MDPKSILQEKMRPIDECEALLIQAKDMVVFDLETTGFSASTHAEILEIGAVRVDLASGAPVGVFEKLIKPMNGVVPRKIQEITNITTDMVADAPYYEDVLPAFYDFLGDSLAVAHNANFDWFRFVLPYMQRIGRIATNDIICTFELSKALHTKQKKHSLEAVCEYYGVKLAGHHRALNDSKYTASVALRLRQEIADAYTNGMGPPKVMGNRLSSGIGFADVGGLRIKYIKPYDYSDKRLGRAVFITTNLGTVYYHINRRCWGFQRLNVTQNIDMDVLFAEILSQCHLTEEEFIEKYSS